MHVSDVPARLAAPAKINLYLRVGSRRDDGFHPLLTWMCAIGLFDMLEFVPAATSARTDPIDLACSDRQIPCDRRNLIVRAADALAAVAATRGHAIVPLSVHLEKRIPVGAGLGGGSSDAAIALMALNRLWKLDLPTGQLHDLAAGLGSDVPFFLRGPSSVCRGRGELVHPVAPPRPRWAVLVLPRISLPTAEVYARFDRGAQAPSNRIDTRFTEPPWKEWTSLSAEQLLPRLVNDLEPAAFALRPELGRLRDALEQRLARPVRMSGSGSSLFTLYDEAAEAAEDAQAVADQMPPGATALAVELAPAQDDFHLV